VLPQPPLLGTPWPLIKGEHHPQRTLHLLPSLLSSLSPFSAHAMSSSRCQSSSPLCRLTAITRALVGPSLAPPHHPLPLRPSLVNSRGPQRPMRLVPAMRHHSVHRGPNRATGPQHHGSGQYIFSLKKNSRIRKSSQIYTEPPELVIYFAAVPRCL
jgi:hypothetical protein